MEKNIHEVTLTKYAAKAGVIKFGTWGSRGIEQLHITALPPWDEAAVITVTFVNGRVQSEPQVFPESMTIDVPQAATSAATKSRASCKMVFKGIDQSGAVVYSTDLPYTVLNRTDIDGAEYDPGENAFEQYIQQVGAYRDTALNAANSARNSELSAEEYADSAKAAKGEARKSAESAAASAAGIAESEKRAAASAANAAGSAASAEETRKQVEKIAAGVAKGNMSVSDYDNDGAVKAAGGMKAYTKAQTDVLAADITKANDSIAEVKTTADAAAAQAEKNKTDLSETNNTLATVQTSLSGLAADVNNLKYVLVSLPASGWSGSAPYTQTVSVSGMTADWVPGVPSLAFYGNVDVTELITKTEALGCIKMITSAAGTLTFTAPEDKPSASLTLRVPGMVGRS
nr:MAG TPA: hypothetical protein [Caudoviricetes sp.]